MEKQTRKNPYQEVTNRIVERLENNDIPWRKPYFTVNSKDKLNYVSRRPYSGINRLLLTEPGEYITFNQAVKEGGRIKKGARGRLIVVMNKYIPKKYEEEKKRLEAEGKSTDHLKSSFLKQAYVFNLQDTENIRTKLIEGESRQAQKPTIMADIVIEDWQDKTGFTIETDNGGIRTADTMNGIALPDKDRFRTEEQWYNAVIYGIARTLTEKDSGRNAAEKALTAEITACMVLNQTGMAIEQTQENTEAKCREWISELSSDYKMIFKCATEAEKHAKAILRPILDEDEPAESVQEDEVTDGTRAQEPAADEDTDECN